MSPYPRPNGFVRQVQPRGCVREQLPRVLDDVVAVIGRCIDEVAAAGLKETADLLAIARLDLRARLAGLSERELAAVAAISASPDE